MVTAVHARSVTLTQLASVLDSSTVQRVCQAKALLTGSGTLRGGRVAEHLLYPIFLSSGKNRKWCWMPVCRMGHKQSSEIVVFSVEEDSFEI